ncbi:MAG: SGNH/GDSL hydrolase family protein [Anaerolineae bacterium]|nr:SGNH/GDSL hydrolase family protein [Anaerolineae bacterium]
MSKTILCYGDSNTWGYDPATEDRFDRHTRWAGVMRDVLGDDYWVIEEGLNGRTTVWDDPIEGYKNGHSYLIPCLETHKPIDLVIIMLGTNDLKVRFFLPPSDIAKGAGVLVNTVQKSDTGRNEQAPPVLLLAPPVVVKLTEFEEMFEGAEAKSEKFSQHFREIAQEYGCHFLDTAQVIRSSPLDGIHFEATEHRKLGKAVAAKVREIV